LLKEIEYLISMEEYEDARKFLDIYIPEADNPLKKSILMRIERHIEIDSEINELIDTTHSSYDGTDPTEYHNLDKKLKYGVISSKERAYLYRFWSAYPRHKSHEYCLEMFNWIVENNGSCCSDLLNYIIDQIIDQEVACFYFVLGRNRGFLSEVRHYIEYYEDHFKPESIYISELEYKQYCLSKTLPKKYLLNDTTVKLRTQNS